MLFPPVQKISLVPESSRACVGGFVPSNTWSHPRTSSSCEDNGHQPRVPHIMVHILVAHPINRLLLTDNELVFPVMHYDGCIGYSIGIELKKLSISTSDAEPLMYCTASPILFGGELQSRIWLVPFPKG